MNNYTKKEVKELIDEFYTICNKNIKKSKYFSHYEIDSECLVKFKNNKGLNK